MMEFFLQLTRKIYEILSGDNLHYEKFADGTVKCIEDEIPFEVPEGWVWCRLRDLFSVCSAKRVLQSDWKKEGIPFYRAREIVKLAENGEVNNELFISETYYNTLVETYGIPKENDLMVSAVGTIGKVYVVKNKDCFYYKDASVICLQNIYKSINSKYAKFMLETSFMQKQMLDNSKGTTVETITISTAQNYLCALPPLNEQVNIVFAIEKIINFIEIIKINQNNLKCFIDNTKSKILDLAIRGKLVPQNPNDEPASVLLEQIRAEKEELIKQGKIKRDKKESFIFRGDDNLHYEKFADGTVKCIEDEIPFEVPEGWEWCRLKSICTKIIDGSHNPPKSLNVETPYIMASSRNIILDKISDLNNVRYLTENDFIKENIRTNLQIDDILLTTVATLGRSCIYKGTPNNLCFQRSVTIIKTLILPLYLKFYFDSPFFQQFIKENSTGTAQKGFYLNQLEMTLICIPPLDYQKQMVKTITDFMLVVSNIEKSLY